MRMCAAPYHARMSGPADALLDPLVRTPDPPPSAAKPAVAVVICPHHASPHATEAGSAAPEASGDVGDERGSGGPASPDDDPGRRSPAETPRDRAAGAERRPGGPRSDGDGGPDAESMSSDADRGTDPADGALSAAPDAAGPRDDAAGPRDDAAGPRDVAAGPRDDAAGPRDDDAERAAALTDAIVEWLVRAGVVTARLPPGADRDEAVHLLRGLDASDAVDGVIAAIGVGRGARLAARIAASVEPTPRLVLFRPMAGALDETERTLPKLLAARRPATLLIQAAGDHADAPKLLHDCQRALHPSPPGGGALLVARADRWLAGDADRLAALQAAAAFMDL